MKKMMKKLFKAVGFIMAGIIALSIVFLFACFVNNQMQLKKEAGILKPTGKIVGVNGKKLHVYSEGKGNLTCVFMSGLGICAPELEFKGLYENMSDEYRIAVVDRAGYGFSDSSNDSRDIDTILEETRKALSLAGEKPPYVLFPHSVSGLEATYWAQKYPEEVKAIIGLDMGYPEAYAKEGVKKSDLLAMKGQAFLVKCGVNRLFPSLAFDKTVLNCNFLSADDKNLYKAITCKKLLSRDVVNELGSLEANSRKSFEMKLPVKTPLCIFLAVPLTEEETFKQSALLEKRNKYYNDYASQFEYGKIIPVRGKHCIYLYSPETIARESKNFLKSIDNTKN